MIIVDLFLSAIYILFVVLHFIINKTKSMKLVIFGAMAFYIIYAMYNIYRLTTDYNDDEEEVKGRAALGKMFFHIFCFGLAIATFVFGIYKYIEPNTIDGINKQIKSYYKKLFESFYKKQNIDLQTSLKENRPSTYTAINDYTKLLGSGSDNSDIITQALKEAQPRIENYKAEYENILKSSQPQVPAPVQQFQGQPQPFQGQVPQIQGQQFQVPPYNAPQFQAQVPQFQAPPFQGQVPPFQGSVFPGQLPKPVLRQQISPAPIIGVPGNAQPQPY